VNSYNLSSQTTLGDVATHIEEVYSPDGAYLVVSLDLPAIQALQMASIVTAESVAEAIRRDPRLKFKVLYASTHRLALSVGCQCSKKTATTSMCECWTTRPPSSSGRRQVLPLQQSLFTCS
jgi:hypothetical protein